MEDALEDRAPVLEAAEEPAGVVEAALEATEPELADALLAAAEPSVDAATPVQPAAVGTLIW